MNYDKSRLLGQKGHENSTRVSHKDSVNDALMFCSSRAFHLITGPVKSPLHLYRIVKKLSILVMYKYTLDLTKKHPTDYSCLFPVPVGLNLKVQIRKFHSFKELLEGLRNI